MKIECPFCKEVKPLSEFVEIASNPKIESEPRNNDNMLYTVSMKYIITCKTCLPNIRIQTRKRVD